jgi:hypothetical protein
MRNFAEELAYWYFRLNGFLIINDFVLHHQDLDINQNADCDLVCVRLPHTHEFIGGRVDTDWDNQIFNDRKLNKNMKIGIICEVKSSLQIKEDDIKFDREDRIRYCAERIGLWPPELIENNIERLKRQKITLLETETESTQLGKILITNDKYRNNRVINLTLSHIEKFIVNKFNNDDYFDAKNGAKLVFPSNLLQYMIWKLDQNRKNR